MLYFTVMFNESILPYVEYEGNGKNNTCKRKKFENKSFNNFYSLLWLLCLLHFYLSSYKSDDYLIVNALPFCSWPRVLLAGSLPWIRLFSSSYRYSMEFISGHRAGHSITEIRTSRRTTAAVRARVLSCMNMNSSPIKLPTSIN